MSLKTEQILLDYQFAERQPRIFSTGVHLVPMKISIRGIEHYVWVADEFNNETFNSDGGDISPNVLSNKFENLYE
ncbi:MAG: hypothetical protein LBG45_09085 [Dysgonamonadaceae bacterium]|jgi:hypothetical protein|nr:hypothetical protein [Dysgonamonadaceae bacterium]